MSPSIREELLVRGYWFVAAFRPEDDSIRVAAEFGRTVTLWAGRPVQQLIPKATDTPNSYSGIYGLGRFPFHTDLAHWKQPPRYLLLRCVKGYAEVPTLLVDGRHLVQAVSRDLLVRAVVKPRRPHNGVVPLLRIFETTDTRDRLRWDEVFLQPASTVGRLAVQSVKASLERMEPRSISLRLPGDTLLIDNWIMLHARTPIPPGCEDRRIERVYLEDLN